MNAPGKDNEHPPKRKRLLSFGIAMAMLGSVAFPLVTVLPLAGAQNLPPDQNWQQTRLQFSHVPTIDLDDNKYTREYLHQTGIYVNTLPDPLLDEGTANDVTMLRLYGEPGQAPPDTYSQFQQPFDGKVIPKDSATFNPAIILDSDLDFTTTEPADQFDWITGCNGEDAHLKKHLRLWYEPQHDYNGPRVSVGSFTPATKADAVVLESTYTLVDSANLLPLDACRDSTFPFPTVGNNFDKNSDGDFADATDITGHEQPGLDNMSQVFVGTVTPGGIDVTLGGTVELENRDVVLPVGGVIQFMDHIYVYMGLALDFSSPTGANTAMFKVYYAGNQAPDSPKTIQLSSANTRVYLTRANVAFPDPLHLDPSLTRTSYIQVLSATSSSVKINVGKEIKAGDIFYVDGVRYDVPAVYVRQGELNYVTLRTSLPKSDPAHGQSSGAAWTSIPDDMMEDLRRESYRQGQWQVVDSSIVTTQFLVQVNYNEPIPVDPPFNQEFYRQVDDTDVQLWKIGPSPHPSAIGTFPLGPKAPAVTGVPATDGNGQPFYAQTAVFSNGEECMTDPDALANCPDWVQFFNAQPTFFGDLINRIAPTSPPSELGINWAAWETSSDKYPIVPKADTQTDDRNFYWAKEWCEERYSTNLHEILLEEAGTESFSRYHIESHPCMFTEFWLPNRSNAQSLYEDAVLDTGKNDLAKSGTYDLLGGDYDIVTSFKLQDGVTRFGFTYDPVLSNALDGVDFYFNTLDIASAIGSAFQDVADTTVRLYGEVDQAAPDQYTQYWHPFDPYIIPKDSATFNPAIILHTDDDFTGFNSDFSWLKGCDETDAHLKKHLRTWYEPQNQLHGPRSAPKTVVDTVVVESTYMVVDHATYQPLHLCTDSMIPFPTEGVNWDRNNNGSFADAGDITGHEQPGLDTMRAVFVGAISPALGSFMTGTAELERRDILLQEGACSQLFDHMFCFDRIETDFSSPDGANAAQFTVCYIGNTHPDSCKSNLQTSANQRVYYTRDNNPFGSALHNSASNTRTSYLQVLSFTGSPASDDVDTVKITVGKEFSSGDIFYVDGVRYDIPAIRTVDGELKYIVLKTPLPKSDPAHHAIGQQRAGNWTSVHNDTVSDFEKDSDGQWQVEDDSIVSTQRLVEIDYNDPIPVDPPFNREHYRMVDDTDVLLWKIGPSPQPGFNATNFPFGPANLAVPGGNGQSFFIDGARYLTDPEPPIEWITMYNAQPTGNHQLRNRVVENVGPAEPGINHNAWETSGGAFPILPVDGNTTFYWVKEWCEGRYSTNHLEILDEDANGTQSFTLFVTDSEPCTYTEFVLPDRSNPYSSEAGNLFTGKNDLVGSQLWYLLNGDYLITTSLVLEDGTAGGAVLPISGFDSFDKNQDCVLDNVELFDAVAAWMRGQITTVRLFFTVGNWFLGQYC